VEGWAGVVSWGNSLESRSGFFKSLLFLWDMKREIYRCSSTAREAFIKFFCGKDFF
jgi:hypothetical protein